MPMINCINCVLITGVTAHHLFLNNVTNSLQMYMELMQSDLVPLINQSLAAHRHQEIVWLQQSLTINCIRSCNPRVGYDQVYSKKIFNYNEAIRRSLRCVYERRCIQYYSNYMLFSLFDVCFISIILPKYSEILVS